MDIRKMKLILCRVAGMEKYQGNAEIDLPIGGGSHPWNDKHEIYNFLPETSGQYFGFVEPNSKKSKKTGNQKWELYFGTRNGFEDTNLNKAKTEAYNNLVVFIAPRFSLDKKGVRKQDKGIQVVGFYLDATLYKYQQKRTNKKTVIGNDIIFNMSCASGNARLIDCFARRELAITGGQTNRVTVIYNADTVFTKNSPDSAILTKDQLLDYIQAIIDGNNDASYQENANQPTTKKPIDFSNAAKRKLESTATTSSNAIKKDAEMARVALKEAKYTCQYCGTKTITMATWPEPS